MPSDEGISNINIQVTTKYQASGSKVGNGVAVGTSVGDGVGELAKAVAVKFGVIDGIGVLVWYRCIGRQRSSRRNRRSGR